MTYDPVDMTPRPRCADCQAPIDDDGVCRCEASAPQTESAAGMLESLSEEHGQLRRNYLDLADALLSSSTGTDQLIAEARRLRAEVTRLTKHVDEIGEVVAGKVVELDVAHQEVARMTAECGRLRLSVEARDAVIAAGQRTIESGNEALSTLRGQWLAERDKLRAEIEQLRELPVERQP